MGKIVAGTFNGTGAALTLGIGFIPDFVRIYNIEDASLASLLWSKHCRSIEQEEGRLIQRITDSGTLGAANLTVLANGAGVSPYLGGDLMAAASTVYLVKDDRDFAKNPVGGGTGIITAWTRGGARTGMWDKGCDTTFVGEGSQMIVREGVGNGKIYEARIVALTADGDAANQVTLDRDIGSGDVLQIGGMFDYRGAAANALIPAGFTINATSVINVNDETCYFEAGVYDN